MNLECFCVFVCVWQVLDDKHSNYLWCPNALRNADRNLWLSCFVSEITPRDKMHSTLLYLRHPSATLIQERLMLRGSSTTPSGSKLFSQGKIWGLGELPCSKDQGDVRYMWHRIYGHMLIGSVSGGSRVICRINTACRCWKHVANMKRGVKSNM